MRLERAHGSKHGLDDRAAVRWLMRQRQPGDAVMTTRLAWPAVWWYGEISIGNEGNRSRAAARWQRDV